MMDPRKEQQKENLSKKSRLKVETASTYILVRSLHLFFFFDSSFLVDLCFWMRGDFFFILFWGIWEICVYMFDFSLN